MTTTTDSDRASRNLNARVAIVTGASSGIGRAIASTLGGSGYRVVAVARRQHALDALVTETVSDTVEALVADVSGAGTAQAIVEHTLARHGRLDILVNAAGYGINAPSESMADTDWDELFAVNLNAVAHLTSAALPALLASAREHGIADVITIGSTAGLSAESGAAAYSASKFAIQGLMDAWRKEYANRDVRFGTVNPGAVATGFGGEQQFMKDWYADMHRRGAVALPEDVARTVALALDLPARAAITEITLRPTRQV